jgi:CRP/FNR family cyclic AMP-dependent transcriptional regulator
MPLDLTRIPLFAKLSPSDEAALEKLLKVETYEPLQPIFWIGDKGTDFYIVRSGEVVLSFPDENGKDTHLATLGPGAFFGEISLLDGGPRTATARARATTELLVLSREQFELFLMDHPAASMHIISVLARRQRETMARLRGVQNVNQVFEEQSTLWERIADRIVNISATEIFCIFHVVWFAAWIYLSNGTDFDPWPFEMLGLIISIEAVFLSLFVLVSANRAGDRAKIQADLDYQTNLKAQHEVMRLHEKLDKLLLHHDTAAPAGAEAGGADTAKQ